VRIWDSQTCEKLMDIRTDARALEYSRDGGLLATVTAEGAVLRSTATWEVRRVIPGLGGPIVFGAGGLHLFGVEGGRWVRWDLEGRERKVLASPIDGAAPEVAAAVGKDRIVVAARGQGSLVAVLSAATGEGSMVLDGLESVESVAGSADGRWVAAGNWHGTLVVWDAHTGLEVARHEALRRGADALGFSPDGTHLFSGGRDQQVRIFRFDPAAPEPLREAGMLRGHSHDVVALRFRPDGAQVFTGSSDSTVRVWDLAARQEEWGPRIHGLGSLIFDFNADATEFHTKGRDTEVTMWGGAPPRAMGVHHLPMIPLAIPLRVGDGSVFVGDRSGGLLRWDLKRKSALWQMRRGSAPLVPEAFSPASGVLAVAEYGGMGRLHLFRPPATQPETTFEDFRGSYSAYTRMAVLSADGRWLIYPGPDYSLRVVDVKTGKLHGSLTGLTWHVSALASSPDNRQVAAGSDDGRLMVWDLISGKRVMGPFAAHSAAVNHVEYSSDGKTLLTTPHAGGLRLWNAANGRSMISIPEAESTGAPLLSEGDRALVFWNLRTGDLERHPAPP
jgi:WD40 repeat protein